MTTLEAILEPLRKQTEHLERLHELDPENELHKHTAALFGYVYDECLERARARGYDLEGEPAKERVAS